MAAARRDGDVGFSRRTFALVGSTRGCVDAEYLVRVVQDAFRRNQSS